MDMRYARRLLASVGLERYRGAAALASAREKCVGRGVSGPALHRPYNGAAVNRYSTPSNESTGKA
jgi:hypothetical protein